MSKKKYILLAILKTWLISTVISMIFLIVFLNITKEAPKEFPPRRCDMSGLSYIPVIFWIVVLTMLSFTSLFSLLKPFQNKISSAFCWMLFPVLSLLVYFFMAMNENVITKDISFFLIMNVPWFSLWIFYFSRFRTLYFNQKIES